MNRRAGRGRRRAQPDVLLRLLMVLFAFGLLGLVILALLGTS